MTTYVILFAVIAVVLGLVVASLVSGRPRFDVVGLVDSVGEARETFSESGTVTVRGEIWKASTRARGSIIQRGDKVRVVEVCEGLTLLVEKAE